MQIAALILRDVSFIREYDDVVDPSYFDYEDLSTLVRRGKLYFDKHSEVPSRASLLQDIEDFSRTYSIPEGDLSRVLSRLDEVYKVSLVNGEDISERIKLFGREQAVRKAVMMIMENMSRGSSLDNSVLIMEEALRVGYNTNSLGFNFFERIKELPSLLRRDDRGFTHKIKSGFDLLDGNTYGGPGRGEVWTVLGLSGRGKSQFLVSVGSYALRQGFTVAHLTVGDLDEEDVAQRYASSMTGCSPRQIFDNSPEFLRKAAKISKYKDKYLRIKYYDPYTVTVAHVKAWLSRLVTVDAVKPDMLIVDYPDEFKLPSDNVYEGMGRIYSELKAISKQYKVVCWTASQVHRWEPKKPTDVLKVKNIADSAKKVHKADGIVSINQSYEEKNEGYARLWVDKVRRGRDCFVVPLRVDFALSRVVQGTLLSQDKKAQRESAEASANTVKGSE